MKFNVFRKRERTPQRSVTKATLATLSPHETALNSIFGRVTLFPFEGSIFDPVTLRYHALRILCGALMDRRSDCTLPHPFCGPSHQQDGDTLHLMIVHAIPATDAIGLFESINLSFCRATPSSLEGLIVNDYPSLAARLVCVDPTPIRKIIASLTLNDKYMAHCGPVLDGLPNDHFTGYLDTSQALIYVCDPEPSHCQWEYWHTPPPDTPRWKGPSPPTYLCIQVFGEWYVFDPDYRSAEPRFAARLELADSPNHADGIQDGET